LQIMSAKAFLYALLAFVCVAGCCMDNITPVDMTSTAIDESFARIRIYAITNGAVPPSLDVLPKRNGYMNRITDGWGRPLVYRVAPDGIITIMSFGRDGNAGGSGEDADISLSYRSRRPDGSLWVGADLWTIEAQVK
jgi:hypothetical protein